jgi:PAS domain S-box-containing protein
MGARSPAFESLGNDFAWSLLDAAPDATVIVSGTGEIVAVNDHSAALFGFSLDDLLGRAVEDLMPDAARQVHRAHRTRYRADPTVRSMGADLELRARRCDGSEFPVEISLSPLQVGDDQFTVAAVRDISDRVAAEEQLHRVIKTLDSTDDAVLIFDAATLRYSFVNEGAVRMVGYDRELLVSMTPLHLNPNTSEADYRELVDSLLVDGSAAVTRRAVLVHRDGREIPVEKTFRPAPAGIDGTRWVITLARDITDRLAAEADLERSRGELRQAEQVVALATDRERIARDLHDTVIQRLFGEGLNLQATMGLVPEPAARARLETTIEGLDETIKELRAAIFSLQTPTSTPGGLRGQLLDVLFDATENLGFEPRLQLEGPIDNLDDRVAVHLVPVLREALSNVAQHAEARHVRVAVVVDDDLRLTVADDGQGMPEEVLGGNGLVNLANRARSLGGGFSIQSRADGGSLLTWHVPIQSP